VMRIFFVGLVALVGVAQNTIAESYYVLGGRGARVGYQQAAPRRSPMPYAAQSGYSIFWDASGRQISAAEYDRQVAVYNNFYFGTPMPATYYTQNNTGTTYGTTNNYGTSYQTINNYGNSHTTVNNYGTGRTTVNDYGAGSVTTHNDYNRSDWAKDMDARLDRIDKLLGIKTR